MRSKWKNSLGVLTSAALLWAVFGGTAPAVASSGGHITTSAYATISGAAHTASAVNPAGSGGSSGGSGSGEGPE